MQIQKEEGSRSLFQSTSELAHVVYKNQPYGEKRVFECEHCKMKGHTKEKCWTLYPHLKPMRLRGNGQGPKSFAGTSVAGGDEMVRKSDLEALIKSITKLSESGKSLLALKTHKEIIVDSGASDHMIKDAVMLKGIRPHNGSVTIANGIAVPIKGIGNLELFEKSTKALYVPEFSSNLLSVHKATKDLECLAVFGSDLMQFQDTKTREVIGEGEVRKGLYFLSKQESNVGTDSSKALESPARVHHRGSNIERFALGAVGTSPLWHARLGHPSSKTLKLVLPNITQDSSECEACILGKHCRNPFSDSSTLYDECFDLVHSDVWTAPCNSRDQYKYFVSFVEEKSKYTWVTLMSSKSQVLESFSKFYNYILTQYRTKIKILRSDNGGEYMSDQFKEFVNRNGMIHQTSCSYTPQQNGVAERKNRHLMEVSRAMMFDKGVPKQFWGDAVITACYLINRLPTRNLDHKSPYEVLNNLKPNIGHLKVFGCRCYVFIPEAQRNKLEPKSIRCMFVGYSTTQKGFKCYQPENKRMYVSRDVKFYEDEGYFKEGKWENLEDITSSSMDRVESLRSVSAYEREGIEGNMEGENEHENEESNVLEETSLSNGETSTSYQEGEALSEGESLENDSTEEVTSQEETSPFLPRRSESLTLTPGPVLRRSSRLKFPPENWKNTRVYFNNLAEMDHKSSCVSPNVIKECSVRTASPIGDSVSWSQTESNTPQIISSALASLHYPIEAYCSLAYLPETHRAYLSKVDENQVPTSYEEACGKEIWIKAMEEEIQSMERNNTWNMTELPRGKKLVGCRWVYTIKYKSTGEVERYKARLVAKGYTQVYGEDYTETFAPVAKLHSVRVLLSIAINLSWGLWQMDVKNAFLQGDLEEEVYMAPPKGYCENANTVCKLRKAIYGLKQSPRAWYQRLSSCLLDKDFVRSEADHTLFTKKGKGGMVVILIYVDDIIITGDDIEGIKLTKEILKFSFDIKDLGELRYFLGIEMSRSQDGMFISQRKYVMDILRETGKIGSKPAKTPIEEGYQDISNGELWPDVKQYQRLVGKLIYLTITRPDICFAVNRVSQHMQAPTTHNWCMVERILRYLKNNPGKGIWLKCNGNTNLEGYCDADWAGDKQDRKSTTGYCTFVGDNLVTWRSKKQKVIALSSAEAEYRAMKEVTKELIWLRALMKDLGIHQNRPTTLYCDNQAALHIASNPVFHERTKHVEVDCHFVREKIQNGMINPMFVKSGEQMADIFTKATTSSICEYIHDKIGLRDPHQPTLRGSVEITHIGPTDSSLRLDQTGSSQQADQLTRETDSTKQARVSKRTN